VALENLRKAKLLEAVVDSGTELLTVQDRLQVYEILKHQIFDKLGVRTFYLALHNRSKDTIRCPFFYHQGEDIKDRIPVLSLAEIKPSESFTVHVLTTNHELEIEDAANHSHPTEPYPISNAKAKAYFAVPLRRPDSTAFGVLSIQSAVPRVFPESLKQAVRALASLVAPTLTRLRRSRLQERILADLMSGDPRAVLQESLRSIWESVNADLVIFYPYDSRRQVFRLDRIQVSPPTFKVPFPIEEELPTLQLLLVLGEHFSEEAALDEVFGTKWVSRYGTRSVGSLTLMPSGSGIPSGIVIVHYRSHHKMDEEFQMDITRFSQFAAVATHLIQQQEQRDAESKRQEIIERLVGISDSAQLTRILEEQLKLTWPNVSVVCHLFLVDRGRRRLYSPLAPPEAPPIPFGDSHPAGLVAEKGKSLLILNRHDSPSSSGLPTETASALYVPVKLGDSLLGALGLESPLPQVFDDMDRSALEEIAESAATALGAAGQGDHARAVIAAAARAAASDPEQELQVLAQSAHDIALIAGGAPTSTTVFLLTGQVLDLVAAWPPSLFGELQKEVGTLLLTPPAGKPRGIVALAVHEKRSQLVDSLPNADYIPFDDQTRAELAVPVLAADQTVVGVLNLEYAHPEALNNEHRTLLERLADQAAIVAILQKQASMKQKQRTTLVMLGVEAADISHAWITNKSTVRNSASALRMLAQNLLERKENWLQRLLIRLGINSGLYKDIDTIDSSAELIQLTLDESEEPRWMNEHIHQKELIDIGSWLRRVTLYWSQLYHNTIEFPLQIETSPADRIFANEYWLTRALRNLAHNAVRATKGYSKPPRISLRSYLSGHSVFIEVWDNGPGIPEAIKPYLFNSLVPRDINDFGGNGTGCLLTNFIAQEYGGNTWILPSEAGARVALELPQAKEDTKQERSSLEG
jgi:signal transduction histidine kinase